MLYLTKFERFRTVQYLVTAMLGVCVSAPLALDIIVNPTFGTVVMCKIKNNYNTYLSDSQYAWRL